MPQFSGRRASSRGFDPERASRGAEHGVRGRRGPFGPSGTTAVVDSRTFRKTPKIVADYGREGAMPDPHPDQIARTSHQDGEVDTLRGQGSPGLAPSSCRPLGIESFTIPPAALEVAKRREGERDAADWSDSSVGEGGMVAGEPPPSSHTGGLGLGEEGRRGSRLVAQPPRSRYTLLLLLVMVFGILLIVAAAVSRSIEVQTPSSVGLPDRGRIADERRVVDPGPASNAVGQAALQPAAANGSAAAVPSLPAAPSSAPTRPPAAASAVVRPAAKSPQSPPKTREFLYENGYRDAPP
jgi:hypothetical protein